MTTERIPISWLNGDDGEKLVLGKWVSKIIRNRSNENQKRNIKDNEKEVAKNIARILLKDLSLKVRAGMARELLTCPTLPHDIAHKIATDVEEVAAPFLRISKAFTEEHLGELVPIVEEFARVSIAKRAFVSRGVGVAIIEFSRDETITVLMQNKGTEMCQELCDKMQERYEDTHHNMRMLLSRVDLPEELIKNLEQELASSYMDAIDKEYLPSGSITTHLSQWVNGPAPSNIMASSDKKEIEDYVKKLHGLGRLTPEVLLEALRHENQLFFEISMTILTGSGAENINRLISYGGKPGLERLLARARISKAYLKRFATALDRTYNRP